jgi:membrane fusion protein, multidrug efflux system
MRLFYTNDFGAASIDDEATKWKSPREELSVKITKRRSLLLAAAVVTTSIGGVFAYQTIQLEPTESTLAKSSHSAGLHLNPNGSELVVRAHTIVTAWGATRAKHAFTGTLQPRYQAALAFRVAGKLSERLVEVGQRVKKGDVLFRLDPEDMELQLRVAEADQISAQSLLKQSAAEEARLKQLRTTGSVSQSEYDLGLSNRDVAKAKVDAADRRITLATNQRTYCDLIADSDGLITSIQAEAGQVVNVGQPVLQLMQNSELEATVSLPENLVADVQKLRATATFWSMPDVELQAELRELSPMADTVSRTYDAKFRLKDPNQSLAIGMTVTILLNNSEEQGICIPITSIAGSKDRPMVWRIEPKTGHVEAVAVDIIQYRTESAIVRGAFQHGDKIVSAGVQRVDEHSLVRVWEAKN